MKSCDGFAETGVAHTLVTSIAKGKEILVRNLSNENEMATVTVLTAASK